MTKQKDLSGFYRHLYKQTFGEEDAKKPAEEPVTFRKETADGEGKGRRQYRPRREEQEEEEKEEEQPTASQRAPSPEDVKPDVNELDKSVKTGKKKQEERAAASASLVTAAQSDRAAAADRAAEKVVQEDEEKKTKPRRHSQSSEDEGFTKSPTPPPPVKVKIDVWKKRTTDEMRLEALERYLQRKAAREQSLVPWP